MNYDPNLTMCGRMATQTVELTFALWDYRKTLTTTVSGNTRGLSVIECAAGRIYEELPLDRFYTPHMLLLNAAGDVMDTSDDEEDGEDWLLKMLIKAEILSIEPEKEDGDPT